MWAEVCLRRSIWWSVCGKVCVCEWKCRVRVVVVDRYVTGMKVELNGWVTLIVSTLSPSSVALRSLSGAARPGKHKYNLFMNRFHVSNLSGSFNGGHVNC